MVEIELLSGFEIQAFSRSRLSKFRTYASQHHWNEFYDLELAAVAGTNIS